MPAHARRSRRREIVRGATGAISSWWRSCRSSSSAIPFHLEASPRGTADTATRLGTATIILLLTLIGGLIVPSLTRNWRARQGAGRLPAPLASTGSV
jgi:uncharacterized protein involved in response to NO